MDMGNVKKNDIAEVLKSLYKQKRIDGAKIKQMLTDGKITLEEYVYIIEEKQKGG